MAGLYGQTAFVDPAKDLVVVVTAHIPASVDASTITRRLLETYVLPAAR
jgi:CubicO group peptidase (beta-lactamase class C family)